MNKSIPSLCMSLGALFCAMPRLVFGQALPPQFVWKSIPPPAWRTSCDANGSAKIEDGVLTASCATTGVALAEAEIDISEYDGRPFEICAVVTGEGVAGSETGNSGFRFAVNYIDVTMGGNRTWPGGRRPVGDFGPEEIVFTDRTEKTRRKAVVQIGISNGQGEVRCDLSTLRIREPMP